MNPSGSLSSSVSRTAFSPPLCFVSFILEHVGLFLMILILIFFFFLRRQASYFVDPLSGLVCLVFPLKQILVGMSYLSSLPPLIRPGYS